MSLGYRIERWKEVFPPNPAMLRLQMVNEGYQVFNWADRQGMQHGSYRKPMANSHWVISGNLEIVIERGGRHVLGPGDRDFLPPNTYHTKRVLGIEPVIYLVGELTETTEATKSLLEGAVAEKAKRKSKRKRLTKAERAAVDAEFEAMLKQFDNFG